MEEGAAPVLSSMELYTRGQPGEHDNRGESMVQKHAEKMQKEKEEKLLAAIAQTLPNIGQMTHVLALQETNWDLDEAVLLLRQFQMENLERLNGLQKKRKQLRDEGAAPKADPAADSDAQPSGSSSGSDEEQDSSDDSREERRKKKKRSRDDSKERSKSRKKSKKSSKSSSHKKKKSSKSSKKKRKDSSPEPAAKKRLTHSEDFGKYGILRETDIYEKRSEFLLWCREVKGQDVDSLGRYEEKEMFREYMEDYNTGTLPHKKYYDLEAYEKYKTAKDLHKQHKRGDTTRPEKVSFNDEEELRRARVLERAKQQADRLEEAYKELKHSSKAQDMREQELLRMQMALAYKTGDRAKAQQLLERLKPDDQKKDEEKRAK